MNQHDEDALDAEFEAIETAAAQWLARRDRGLTPAEVEAFTEWCAADPRHEIAISDLTEVWGALDDLSALRGSPTSLTSPSPSPAAPAAPTPPRAFPARWVVATLAAAAAVVLGVVVWQRPTAAESEWHYATAIGEQRTVSLPDHSEIQLNTNTALTVRYRPGHRDILLERGEAYFAVAKDSHRPFTVASGNVEARAVGTAFIVCQRGETTELVVSEGRVRFGGAASKVVAEVAAGETATMTGNAAPVVTDLGRAHLARRLAWQSGWLEFENAPLSEVVAEFGRYHQQQLTLDDNATGLVRVGGRFRADNLDGFIRQIEKGFGIVVRRREANAIVLGVNR